MIWLSVHREVYAASTAALPAMDKKTKGYVEECSSHDGFHRLYGGGISNKQSNLGFVDGLPPSGRLIMNFIEKTSLGSRSMLT